MDDLRPLCGAYSAREHARDYDREQTLRLAEEAGARTFELADRDCAELSGGMSGASVRRLVDIWRGTWAAEGERLMLAAATRGAAEGADEERWPEPSRFTPDASRFTATFRGPPGEPLGLREAALRAAAGAPLVAVVEADASPDARRCFGEPRRLVRAHAAGGAEGPPRG